MSMNKPYVYKLIHKDTGQFYIGYREANKLPAEFDLPRYKTSSKVVRAMGFENFNWEILGEFESGEDAFKFEQSRIAESFESKLCLNEQYRLPNGNKRFHSATAGAKISEANRKRITSEETRTRIKAFWDEEARTRQRINRLGRKDSDEARKQKTEAQLKKPPMTDETKRKISEAHKGMRLSEESRRKISEANRNKKPLACPHCGKECSMGNLKRWHLDNCKEK